MKLIAMTLLLANIVLLALQFQGEEQKRVTATGLSKGKESGTIVLLSEVTVGAAEQILSDAVENPIRTEGESGLEPGECYGIGPFVDVFSGQDALEQLSALDLAAELRVIDEPTGESDYRVLIPPASSAEEAFRKLRELQASDIDSYVITEGDQSMGISLGVFSALEGAQALLGQVEGMGYRPEVIEIPRQSRSYWVEVDSRQFARPSVENWLATREGLASREMICTES